MGETGFFTILTKRLSSPHRYRHHPEEHHTKAWENMSHAQPHIGMGSYQAEALTIMAELVVIGLALAALMVGMLSR